MERRRQVRSTEHRTLMHTLSGEQAQPRRRCCSASLIKMDGGVEVRLGIWLGLLDLVREKAEGGARDVVPVVAGSGVTGRDSAAVP
jgi:hypothetical protein